MSGQTCSVSPYHITLSIFYTLSLDPEGQLLIIVYHSKCRYVLEVIQKRPELKGKIMGLDQ